MRTLNRPMFRMGGPIKEGVMHGIREPRRGGGRAALVGNPMYPSTMGREHHSWYKSFIPKGIMGSTVTKKPSVVGSAWDKFKGLFGKTGPGTTKQQYQGYSEYGPVTYKTVKTPGTFQPNWFGRAVQRDPVGKIAMAGWRGKGVLGKPLRWAGETIATPTGALGLMYVGGRWLKSDGTPATDAEVNAEFNFKGGTKPGEGRKEGMYYKDPDAAKKLAAKKRDERINNLLETMGYDAAKKDAVSKALIDASQIVSDRGTLDKKNITRELINHIIQATSKRLEKPEQLNEAVRLMLTKAEIEKEMNPLKNEALRWQIAAAKKKLAGPTFQELKMDMLSKGQTITGENLQNMLRATGVDSVVLPFKIGKGKDTLQVATEKIKETWTNPEIDRVEPGIYVVRERIIEVKEDGSVSPLDV